MSADRAGLDGRRDDGARRAGPVRRAGRALAEELYRPRARLRRALRRAAEAARASPRSSAAGLVLLTGALFLLYATGAGPVPVTSRAAACGTFLAVFLALTVGGPVLLAYAWPALAAGAVGLLVWGASTLGPGAAWLWVATVSAFLIVYLASAELAPLVGAAGLARLASELGRTPGIVVFLLALALFYWARRRLAASILAAAWTGLAGSAAAQVAWLALRGRVTGDVPSEWAHGILPGPRGLLLWVIATALIAARFVWRRRVGPDATPTDFE